MLTKQNANAKKARLVAECAREVVPQEIASGGEYASNGVVTCVFDGNEEVETVEAAEMEHASELRRSQRNS
jgi:hypothetical protein